MTLVHCRLLLTDLQRSVLGVGSQVLGLELNLGFFECKLHVVCFDIVDWTTGKNPASEVVLRSLCEAGVISSE